MKMQWHQDVAFDRLREHEQLIRGAVGTNEDTTRLRAIDTTLFDVLGWDKLIVETEKYCRAVGYADYAFSQDESMCLILEAKRQDTTFVLPEKKLGDGVVGFGLLASECPAAGDALRQATGYAASEGARYVAISNGHQWILGLAFVQDQPIEQRSVYVFQSFDDIAKRFSQFWDCFSPEGIFSNTAASRLLESRKASAPDKLSDHISNYPAPADRNVIVNEIEVVVGLIWDQMNLDEGEEQFLRECYVRPEASTDSITEAKEILQQRFDTDQSVSQEALDATDLPTLIETYKPEKPIIVLGRIGHGKSTFLRYLRLIEAEEVLRKYIQIDIDFLDRPDKAADVAAFMYSQIDDQLRSRYDADIAEDGLVRGVLHSDLSRFKKTPTGKFYSDDKEAFRKHELEHIQQLQKDKHSYFGKVFYHLKHGRGHSTALFFDNLDRRGDDIQEEAFLRASAIARDWSCLVFVCLRPSTFYRSKGDGILDTVAPKTLAVAPPKTSVLLKKRLQYSAQVAEGDRPDLWKRTALSANVSVHLRSTAKFLRCCAESFFKSKELAWLFEAASNGNVRDLLRYVRVVLTSKHLDTGKILDKIGNGGYRIPVHEALRALLYGDKMHFDPDTSVFVNLFDIQRADPMEHFSRMLALRYLDQIPPGTPTYAYCRLDVVIQYLCQLGYSGDHATSTIRYLYSRKCCEGRVPDQNWKDVSGDIRITNLGRYTINDVIYTFDYHGAVVVDTPILDEKKRAVIRDVFPIRRRLDRGDAFVDYLRSASRAVQDADAVRFCDRVFDTVKRRIEQIRASLDS
ncbi:MAG: hypothetical protein H8E44_34550 [Planctomycetes bacterium]|nr:hypothetical protein [Planctomycetota bacterium]MBL7043430.1 hypothetical protein [Pirellulaceae bacterium]